MLWPLKQKSEKYGKSSPGTAQENRGVQTQLIGLPDNQKPNNGVSIVFRKF